jgi:hypothetical protein
MFSEAVPMPTVHGYAGISEESGTSGEKCLKRKGPVGPVEAADLISASGEAAIGLRFPATINALTARSTSSR